MTANKDEKMATPGVDEFFSQMKQLYEMNEEQWTKVWDQILTSEAYANVMGITGTQLIFLKELMKRNSEQILGAANVPTKDDLAGVAKQVVATEEKLDDLVFKVEDLSDVILQMSKQIADMQSTLNDLSVKFMSDEIMKKQAASDLVNSVDTAKKPASRSSKKKADEEA